MRMTIDKPGRVVIPKPPLASHIGDEVVRALRDADPAPAAGP
jgi:hypothetical protein